MILHKHEKILLKELKGRGRKRIEELEMNADSARRAAFWLAEKGFALVEEKEEKGFVKSAECERYLREGFPEINILNKNGALISELGAEEKIGLMWAKKNGWITLEDGKINVVGGPGGGEYSVKKAASKPEEASLGEIKMLKKRKLVSEEVHKEFSVQLTEKGEKEAGGIGEIKEEIGKLTKDIIANGGWEGAQFRKYALAPTRDAPLGKVHPLTRMIRKVKRVFMNMGFEEMEGNMVESAFWNFDALFQPQDHPARELADTFYVEGREPLPQEEEFIVRGKTKLPEKELVKKVKESHEKGWKYQWSPEEAKKRVLRTHTTALSARYLHAMEKKEPKKYFAVGRVFRNEATDFKHLAEFHQVEGIVAWEGATFRDLMGLLKEFYLQMGFEKVRFRPSYFPYTEPSMEIDVYLEDRGEWMELGGSGIFRPEMTESVCDTHPVLAWGLSLERPMMLMEGLKDIRTFYKNDLDWLKGSSVDR